MKRILLPVLAWVVATVAATGVSWLGVHSVLVADSFGTPQPVIPLPRTTTSAPSPPATTTTVPAPASRSAASQSATPTGTTSSSVPAPTSSAAGATRGFQLTGGQVVLELGETSARLVSATPSPGWSMRNWQADGWLRVDFSNGTTTSSCFVTWNGHPPQVQTT